MQLQLGFRLQLDQLGNLRNAKSHKTEEYLTSLEELKLVVPSSRASNWFLQKNVIYGPPEREEADSIIIDFSACKALKSFSVVNESPYDYELRTIGWIMETKLITGVPYAQLTSLHIVEQMMSQSFALSILRESKNLRTVILRQINWLLLDNDVQESNGAREQIHLDFLETLDLSFSTQKERVRFYPARLETDSPDFIGQLETPALQNLILAWDYDGPNIRVFQIIPQMLQRAKTSLRTLRLYGVRSDVKTLVPFLETLPGLHVVEIAPARGGGRSGYGSIMEHLSHLDRGLLPHLKELTIWDKNLSPGPFLDRAWDTSGWLDTPNDIANLDSLLYQDFSRAVTLIEKRNIEWFSPLQRVKLVLWVTDEYLNPGSPFKMDLEERLETLKSSNNITPELVLHPMEYIPTWEPYEPEWPRGWASDLFVHRYF
ncbi:hypothetical protein H0H92_007761 [Tricholoma furcatifolium]|nr:hypothetical protein H0H92_007761 [Tricholoma furcatifolium]